MTPRSREGAVRPFWSGTLTFGLVSIPVELFAATRSGVSLRMLDEDGTPLRRRYFCPAEERSIERDEIVRGYEVEDGEFVLVSDEELEALEPEKSRDIDLRLFVERADLPPLFYDRGYFLAPAGDSTKAYRLLARIMEEKDRAGIATFVMRDREYLVAILADDGVLRAETLRFHDEIRSPDDVGLPEPGEADDGRVREMEEAIDALAADEFDADELTDTWTDRLLELVEAKRSRGEDVVEPEAGTADEPDEEDEDVTVIDIMEVLKRRLAGGGEGGGGDAAAEDGAGDGDDGADRRPLEDRTKDELYDRARALDIEGRSRMNKDELIRALRDAG